MVRRVLTVALVLLVLLSWALPVSAQSFESQLKEGTNVRNLDIPGTVSGLKGYSAGGSAPDVDVYVFADLTETSFSGKVLTESIPSLLSSYPKSIRVRYIHSVLPYRDTPNTRNAIVTATCLSRENKFWNNIRRLVETQGKWDTVYPVDNSEAYLRCLLEANTMQYLDAEVKYGQDAMASLGITGVPSALFVSAKHPKTGILVMGAVPGSYYTDAIKYILSIPSATPTPAPRVVSRSISPGKPAFFDWIIRILRAFRPVPQPSSGARILHP